MRHSIHSTRWVVSSPEEMIALGASAAKSCIAGSVFALVGDLGAGKTHWTKGLVSALGSESVVTSPTFGLVHEYQGGVLPVFHMDFYRTDSPNDWLALGWDEYLDANGVTLVEWADKFPELMPPDTVWLHFAVRKDGAREVRVMVRADR